MDAALHDLIKRTKDNTNFSRQRNNASHIMLIPQLQYISIRRDKYNEFWEGYCSLVYKGESTYALAEINTPDMPVVAIMTFQFNTNDVGSDELFNDAFLMELIYAYQEGIKDKVNLSLGRSELTCVQLESERTYQEGNSTFYQVRLQFPHCLTETGTISKIREKAISVLRRRNAMKELKVSPENDWDRIIDSVAHLEPLPLYKSIKAIGRPKMTLTAVYGEIGEEHLGKDVAPLFKLEDIFDPRAHSYFSQGLIDEEILENNDGNLGKSDPLFWLPLILSTSYSNSIVLPKLEGSPSSFVGSNENIGEFGDDANKLTRCQYFLQYLSQERAVDIFSWRDVGRALYSSSEGNEEGLKIWIDFTEQSDHFSEEDCVITWQSFENEAYITYKTLAWYAKQDAPEEYKSWHQSWCNEALERALQMQHAQVAEYIYRLYWLEIACADADKSVWFRFNGNRWCRKQKTVLIPDRINREIIPNLEKLRIESSQRVHTLVNHVEKQPEEARIKSLTELIARLNDQPFISQIIRASTVPFHTEYENFVLWRDNNPNLMGCADCVIEADEKGVQVRSGKPEDYITMSTGMYLKRNKYHWNHPHVIEVMEWLKKVHVDTNLRHEHIKEMASWLRGRNINKRLPIWTGHKDNSKSMLIRALELALGDYLGKFPTSILTGRRTQSSSCTPELTRSKGKHSMIIQETDEEAETFKKGIAKELSGNDSIFNRGLYEEGSEFIPMFKLTVICNKVPRFIGNDPAIKSRVRIIPFLSTWDDEAPDDPAEQFKLRLFKKDPYFEIRLPLLAPALLWVLVQYYPKYIEEGIREPPIVKAYTEKYWKDQDIYIQYIEDCIIFCYADEDETEPDRNAAVSHLELYRHFKGWLNDSMPGMKVPNTRDAREGFEKHLFGFENKKWIGIRISRAENVLDI